MICALFMMIEILEELRAMNLRSQNRDVVMGTDTDIFDLMDKIRSLPGALRSDGRLKDVFLSCLMTVSKHRQFARMKWLNMQKESRKRYA